ncbi:DUF3151 domain-containing protein [Corynebacterium mendelii]|uniref:DUF3151 domain-containing protein n=1 Tax=Corynebacterium mendelii TaxID=2765362 RepID=A0A939E2D2_9CORY|nr:DUF3151 domain-containing protein [Corynebacterium mendelii]MBN9644508.1 DUF3151 domain-containing protein [Corynebacterium mendelii]
MSEQRNLLAPPPVLLPDDPVTADGATPADAIAHPASPVVWAVLAEQALATAESDHDKVTAYALARTGYHRGLDTLRRNGWKGFGPVPWSHEANRGVIRAIAALAKAAETIGETDEYDRCRTLVAECDPACEKMFFG